MAEGKNKIMVYRDWLSTFEALSDEEAGRLIKHFFRYVNDLNPEVPDRITLIAFEPIKQTLKRDLKSYEAICLKNKDNVNIRWNKEDTTVYDRIRTDTKHTDKDSDKDNDKEKKIYNRGTFVPPTIEEIKAKMIERNLTKFTAEAFHAHYTANGWMVGKNKMKDWNSALTTWDIKSKEYAGNSGSNKIDPKRTNSYWD